MVYGINAVIGEEFARENKCFATKYDGDSLSVLIADKKYGSRILDKLGEKGVKKTKLVESEENEILRLTNMFYSIEIKEKHIFEEIRHFLRDEQFESLFLYILEKAQNFGATDIHIIREKYCIVRFRIKGRLKTFCVVDEKYAEILGRIIKVKGNVDISKSLRPLDTRLEFWKTEKTDIRVSIVSTINGEKISLRLLNNDNVPKSLSELMLDDEDIRIIKKAMRKESGLIIITGPTGSGKSTTVRCFINEINDSSKHIISIEDPIEYKMSGVTQMQVDDREKNGFADGVRAILRQDPDVLFIGEIRDEISAEVAMKAGITGHLVFTTLHTKSANLAVERLENLQVDRNLIFEGVSLIINQRLVGENCEFCKKQFEYDGEYIEELGLKKGDKIFQSEGCIHCDYSGISRRFPIISILVFDEQTKNKYKNNELIEDFSIREKAIEKFNQGKISLYEVRRFI